MTNNTWNQSSLSEITLLIKDGTHGTHKDTADGIPLLSAKDIHDGIIETDNNPRRISKSDYETIHKNYEIKKGDILLTIVGTIGRSAIVNDVSSKFTIQRSVAVLRMNDSVIPEYAYQFIRSEEFQKGLAQGSQGLAQSGIYLGELGKKRIPIPSINVQRKIGDILSSIDEAIQKTDHIIQKSEVLKSGLMNELLTKGIGHSKFKKTKLGEIPEGWDVVSLQDLIDTGFIKSHLDGNHGELYPKSSEFTEDGIPYISANNLKSNQVDFNGSKYLSILRAKQFKKGVALNGDVLFAHNATVGPVAMLKTNYSFVILSTSLTYYRCDVSKLNPEYLLNYMQSEMFKAQYQRIMSQTTRNQVPITAQRVLLHVVPPIDEQTEIAKILSSVDANISKNYSEKAELIKLKNGLMHDIFNQKVQIN